MAVRGSSLLASSSTFSLSSVDIAADNHSPNFITTFNVDTITIDDQACSHQRNKIISRGNNSDGSKRYRYECRDCSHRWTEGKKPRSSKLTDEQVLEILAAPTNCNMTELGRKYGVHRETIRQVRCGMIRSDLRPDLERIYSERTCENCRFHTQGSGCVMRFPEYVEIGRRFAAECITYMKICDSSHAHAINSSQN